MVFEGLNFFLTNLEVKDFLDLFLLYLIFYYSFKISERSGVFQVLLGLGVLSLAYYICAQLELIAVHSLLQNIFANFFLVLVLIFQGDIRRVLTQIGSQTMFKNLESVERVQLSEEIAKTLQSLSKKGVGALFVFERNIDLSSFVESGVQLSSLVKAELLEAVFHPTSKIHDGAVVIKNGKVESAGIFLPLSTNPALDRNLGTRHRSALGITEVSDAKVVVLSEESQNIALVEDGRIRFVEDATNLALELRKFLSPKRQGISL